MSHTKSSKFKYPVVHSVNVKNQSTFIYSSTKDKGMFGDVKVIFGRRACGVILDLAGEYACSQDTRYLVSTYDDAPKVMKAMLSPKFIDLMGYLNWNSTAADRYNKDALALFRKDFWKEFI
jgi:hypothetical protein